MVGKYRLLGLSFVQLALGCGAPALDGAATHQPVNPSRQPKKSSPSPSAPTCAERVEALGDRLDAVAGGEPLNVPVEGAQPWVAEAVDGVRNASTPVDRAYRVAELGSRAVHGCEPLKRAFASVATMPVEGRWEFLREAVPKAVRRCNCSGVDIAGMDSYMVLTREPEVGPPSEKLAEMASRGRSVYWWIDGHCQRWEFTPAQHSLRRDQPGMVPLDVDFKIGNGTIVLTGPRLAKADVSAAVARRTRGPRIVGCHDRLEVEAVGSHWIEFAGGGAWSLDEASCRVKDAPAACITAVAATTKGTAAGTDRLQPLIRRGDSVFWMTDEGCQAWRFDPRRRRLHHNGVYYEYEYGGSSIRLSGPNQSAGSMGMGSFGYYDVLHTDAGFVLVDGFPWYLGGSACSESEKIIGRLPTH